MPKFNAAKAKATKAKKSQVFLNPYKSVSLPLTIGAIADPNANAIF